MNILFAGDYCPRYTLKDLIEDGKYESVFSDIIPIIKKAHYSIVNLECAISENGHPIQKKGPNLSCSEEVVKALKEVGFQCVSLANNHFRDFGDRGCIDTLSFLNKIGLDYVGGGGNYQVAKKTLFKVIEGKQVAFINRCEHEFSIATDDRAGAAPIDYIDLYKSVLTAKKVADIVIVIIHGGHEHYNLPSPRMQELYRWLIELGTDAIINHHQHCVSGYEIYKGKPIFYGVGNFCFDHILHKDNSWNEGIMVLLKIDSNVNFEVIPYFQGGLNNRIELLQNKEKEAFEKKMERLNSIIENPCLIKTSFVDYVQKVGKKKEFCLMPYSNRLLTYAYAHHLLPSKVNLKRILSVLNNIECEAHRDIFIQHLNSIINNC